MKYSGKLSGEDGKEYPFTIEIGEADSATPEPTPTTTTLEATQTTARTFRLRASVSPAGVHGSLTIRVRELDTDRWTQAANAIQVSGNSELFVTVDYTSTVPVEAQAFFSPVDIAESRVSASQGVLLRPTPELPVPTFPAGANTVRIGTKTFPLTAIDPPTTDQPGGRGNNELIIITKRSTPARNRYGWEATVGPDGKVLGAMANAIVPPVGGCYVLSGHLANTVDSAGDFVYQNAVPGATVEVLKLDVPKPPVPVVVDRKNNVAMWVMMWPNSPGFDWSAIPDAVDEVRLSFINGKGVPVGWGPWGKDNFQRGLKSFLDKRPGRFASWSIGGGGYNVDMSIGVDAWVRAINIWEENIFTVVDASGKKSMFGQFGGGNVDWEHPDFASNYRTVGAILRKYKARSSSFYCSWSPNGSFKSDYAKAVREFPDVCDELSFQCYDISGFTWSQYVDKVLPVFNGIPKEKLGLAMMIDPDRNDRWTLPQCNTAAIAARSLGITKTALWHAGMSYANNWAQAMRGVNSQ